MSDNTAGPYPTAEPGPAKVTAGTLAAGGVATTALGAANGSVIAIAFGTVALIAAAYEWLAIYTDDFPTITEHIKHGGWLARVAVIVVGGLALLDHFGPGWVL